MSTTYKKYLKELNINKNKPVKIQFSDTARGFYCPTCRTGTYNKKTQMRLLWSVTVRVLWV